MPAIIQYLLKLSVSVAVIHAFYYLVLRRLTFYNLNRWYLSGYTLLCFIIPFINITQIANKADEKLPVLNYIPSVQNIQNYIPKTLHQTIQHSWGMWDLIIGLLTLGSMVMLAKLIVEMISFIQLKQKAEVLSDNGAVIYHIDEQVIPFSFGNFIYLNKNSHTDKELEEIIMHEYVHVKQMHSADILIAELFCVINWYNPFAWFMRHSIRQNLEFIADDNVVRSGINKKDYQYHLLKVVGIPQYRIANQFNFSSLKKRIIMMNQQRSAKIHLLKFMFILPLLAVTLLAFRSEIANAIIKVKHMPITIKFVNNVSTLIAKPIRAADTNPKQTTINPQITDDGQMKFTSLDSAVVDNVKRFITLFGDARLSNTTGGIEAPIIMVDKNKNNGGIDFKNALVELDGKKADISAIDLNKITSVNVLRSKTAATQFGNKGKYGALLYSTHQLTRISIAHTPDGTVDVKSISADGKHAGEKDTTKLTTTTTAKRSGSVSSNSFTTGYGTVNSSDLSLSPGNSFSTSTQTGNVNGFTSTTVLPANSLGGPKGMIAGVAVPIYDADDLVSIIDPQHIEESQLDAIKKEFTDNGFDLKITADIKDGKAKKISISISGSHKNNSSSSVYSADDITDKDKIMIKIKANKKTGSVSIDSTAEDDDTK